MCESDSSTYDNILQDNISQDNISQDTSSQDISSQDTSSQLSVYNINLAGDIINNYNVIIELGRGSYSIVWLVYSIKDSNFYAMKVQNPEDFDEGVDEINILKKIPPNEQYINKLVDYFVEVRIDENDDSIEYKFMCSVYKLCCGNLDGLSRKGEYANGFSINVVKKILKQVCSGLNTIHTKLNGFHGDIKPDNILLCGINNRDNEYIELYKKADYSYLYNKSKNIYMKENDVKKISIENKLRMRKTIHEKIIAGMPYIDTSPYICKDKYIENPMIKITDFGFYCHDNEQFNESFGTCYYMAPEIILKGDCTNMVDIWALGCMMYELVTGEILFDSDDKLSEDNINISHLNHITKLCGNFDIKYLNKTEHGKEYTCKKNINKNNLSLSTNSIVNAIHNKLKEHDINDIVLADLLEKMLRLTPTKRYTCKEIISHKWLTN